MSTPPPPATATALPSDPQAPEAKADEPKKRPRLGIYALTDSLQREVRALSKKDMADLKRLSPNNPRSDALLRIYMMRGNALTKEKQEHLSRWAILLRALAHFEVWHNEGLSLGRAMFGAECTDLALAQFLESAHLASQVERITSMLSGKGKRYDFGDLAWFIFAKGGAREHVIVGKIARDFYRARHSANVAAAAILDDPDAQEFLPPDVSSSDLFI